MADSGRERRRKGPINALRRQLYGLVLMSASIGAQAADERQQTATATPQRQPIAQVSRVPWSYNDVLMVRNPGDAGWLAYGGMAALNQQARLISPDFAYLPVGELLFTAHFLGDDIDKLRKGLGVDLALPALGYFHLNLYSGRDGPNRGKRWQVNPSGFALPETQDHFWSLGCTLDLAKPDRESHRQLMVVPQLIMNIDQVAKIPGHLQVAMSYRGWNSPVSGLLPASGRVPQVTFKWSY